MKYRLEVTHWAPDFRYCTRSWCERLFTRPWRPFERTKTCGPYVLYHEDRERGVTTLLASPKTAANLKLDAVIKHWTETNP